MREAHFGGWQTGQQKQPFLIILSICGFANYSHNTVRHTVQYMLPPYHRWMLTSIIVNSESCFSVSVWMLSFPHLLPKWVSQKPRDVTGCEKLQNSHQRLAANVFCLAWSFNSWSLQQLWRETTSAEYLFHNLLSGHLESRWIYLPNGYVTKTNRISIILLGLQNPTRPLLSALK